MVKHFGEQHLRFPNRLWGGLHDGEVIWESLQLGRVLGMLHNPAYAGVYVYGRTQTRSHPLPGEAPRVKGRTRQIKRENWAIFLPEAHPGYITWERFLRNQIQLDDNRTFQPEQHRGAVREGAALLQGIVLCGRCGRRTPAPTARCGVSVHYSKDSPTLSYTCNQAHTQLADATCQTIQGNTCTGTQVQVWR